MLNLKKVWHEHLTDLSSLPVRCDRFTLRNPKKSFFNIIINIFKSIYVLQKKTNSSCCTAALAVYLLLLLPIICIALVLRLGHATGGARVLIRTCWNLLQWLLATWAEFQHSVVYYATNQCLKRLEACNAGGHSEHLLWHCLPDIPVATHHNRFFSEPPLTTHNWLSSEPPAFERTQQTFSQMKKFCISQVNVGTFSGGVGKWITVCFLVR